MVVVESPEISTTTKQPQSTTTKKPFTSDSIPFDSEEPMTCSEQFSPYRGDCNKYYLCDNGNPLVQSCPPGLHWNNNQRNCDWPHSANCDENSNLTPNKPTSAPIPSTTTTRKPRPKPPTDVIPLEQDDGKFKVVCYFSEYRSMRKFQISKLYSSLSLQIITFKNHFHNES